MSPAEPTSPDADRIRWGIVGLGWIAQAAVLPAFANARRNSTLAALVSGDEAKRSALAERYGLSRAVSYDDYEALLDSGDIDAVYIALPNHLHRDYAVRAARAGVHVLCEKPMAPTAAACMEMVGAAEESGTRLMIAYRLHLEPANRSAVRRLREGAIGEPRLFTSLNTQQVEAGDVRLLEWEKGGGPLFDVGIYCVNAARYLLGDEPLSVWAATGDSGDGRFEDSEEGVAAVLRFPGGRLATFGVSFNAAQVSTFRVVGTQGELRLEPAYAFRGARTLTVSGGGEDEEEERFPDADQFGPQLLYFADCILERRDPEPSGEEGVRDVRILEALHRSRLSGEAVELETIEKGPGVESAPALGCPALEEPELVHASDPTD